MSIDNKNIIPKISQIDAESLNPLNVGRKFGRENDYVEFHMFDMGGRHITSIENYLEYTVPENIEDDGSDDSTLTNTIFVDPYKKVGDLGYTTGQYIVVYRLQRAKIIDTLNKVFIIKELSPSKLELKCEFISDQIGNANIEKHIGDFTRGLASTNFFRDFTLNFGENNNVLATNIIYQEGEIGIKLYEPLPLDLEVGEKFRIVEDIVEPIEFSIDLGEPDLPEFGIDIKGPNFRIDTRLNDSIPSKYKNFNDFVSNTNSSSLYTVLNHLSGSIELSIDYTNTSTGSLETGFHFENFTHFGSAEERLKNFKYKLELLELYQRQIDEINTIQGSISGSATVTGNKNLIESKISKIKSNFDNYERFLYYEFHPYAWPKVPDFGIGTLQVTGSTLQPDSYWLQVGLSDCEVFLKPYNLRPTTSSEAVEWFGSTNELNIDYGGQILSASRFDGANKHSLIRTIPEHIAEREENENYVTFTNMVGHYFDQIWLYIDHITEIRNANSSLKKGISKDLVFTALSSLGIKAFDQFENEELFEYIIGTSANKAGSFGTYQAPEGQTMITSSLVTCDNGGSSMPKGDITKEVWKRLYHNLPYLLKTKGTERGIKALMNCYGVPETILNIKEYGGPTTDETTYKTFNYEKFSRALAGSSDLEGYFIKAPWASSSSLFTGTIESKPNRSEGKIIFSIGAVKDLFNAPFPKTVELTATDLSVHTFTSNYDFILHGESGLETAQSLAGAIDAHTLFSASVFVREDLYDPAHEKYNLDIEIMITQHLQGIDGNTEIKGTLFEDTLTPACGNPQQFPEVEFLTKVDFNAGGGINNSTSITTVIPGINTCSSKTLIENGIAADGSGNLINNGLFQDEAEFMDFVTDVTNGYTDIDISLYSFESLTPSAIPLYLGEFQCKGINDYGLFVIECFKADDCVNIKTIVTPTTVSPGTTAVGTITIPNTVGGNNSLYNGETVILTSADGTAHTFTLTGGGSVNSIGQDLTNAINANPNFNAINLDSVPQRDGYALEITTVVTGSNTNNPIQGSALNMGGDAAFMSITASGLIGGTDSTGGEIVTTSNNSCSAVLDFYVDGANLSFSVTTTQFTDYIVQGSTGDSTYDNYLAQAIPYAAGTHIYDGSAYVTSDGNAYNYGPTNSDYVFSHPNNQIFVTSTTIQASNKQGYLDPSEILNYCSSNCSDVSSTSDACYTNYTTFINALNADGIINSNIPGINVDTKWSELKASDIITHFPASSSCGCNEFTTGTITTSNILTQLPTVNSSIPLGQGAQNSNYGKFGVKFYSDTTTTTTYNIDQSNTYFGGTSQNDGRLNNIGVWDGTNPWLGNNTLMNPTNQWIGFSKCINVPADGEYLIGLAGDNRIRFAVNGEMLIEKDTSSTSNFNYWWVYKVNLIAGDNTIVLEGKNDENVASFGCDIVGPFPIGTFNSDADFQNIDNNGITLNGITYTDLEDAYKNNIIFTSDPGPNQLTPYVDFTIGSGDTDYWQVDSPNQMTIKNGYPQNANLRRWINSFHNLVIGCEYTINYTISNDGGVNSKGLLLFDRQGGNWGGTTHTDGQCWIAEQQGGNNCNNDTFTVTFTATDLHTSGVVDQGGVYFYSSQNQSATITINSITSTTCGGGEFNTQTNSCPEGYLFNECTGLCEKTEITTTTGSCDGMVINPEGNGSFETSADFVDYFTDFDNGFYGQNIDDYYFESDEPLPWGTFVEDQCIGSNGLPIRRVVGFRKDQSILPLDTVLYTNYQTFVNQLNVDGHGVETPPTNFSNLTAALITGSFEGSCQHKTLITNPLTSDGSFPTPGSGNTGMVDFLEYYSEQTNNIQNIAVDGFKFPVDPDSLTQTFQETCPLDATIYCFYDGTSMTATVFQNVVETVENWVAEQGANFTGTVYHMVNSYERWLDCARLPFTNIGDHLQNGGFGSITTIHSDNDNISKQAGVSGYWNSNQNNITGGEKAFGGSHIWHKLVKNGTGNTRSKEIYQFVETGTIVIQGQVVPVKSVINDGNGMYDDEVPNSAGSLGGTSWTWRGPAPSLQNATDKALVFNFYDESSETSNSGKRQYHQSSTSTNPTFGNVGLTQAKIQDGTSQGQKDWRVDYELFIKTYFENIDRTANEYENQGDLINFMYPSAPEGLSLSDPSSNRYLGVDGTTVFQTTQLAFPLHVWSSILTGSAANPGMLETGHEYLSTTPPANNAIYLNALDSSGGSNTNPYAISSWQNETSFSPPTGYDPQYGYGGLQNYGWVVTSEAVQENAFTGIEFENALGKVLSETLCADYSVTQYTDPNICLDENGNMLFTVDEFFMNPSISSTSFSKYTDYITEGQNLGYALTLGDTRLESQIEGPIAVDECICADVCPNNLVLNNNTIISITGSSFDQGNEPFIVGDSLIQSNNSGCTLTVTSIDYTSNSIIVEVTNGILNFTDPLISTTTGIQYFPDSTTGEFTIPQPQGVFSNYNEYMQFISDSANGFAASNLNTLKFQLVDQSFQEITTEEEDCSVNADLYVFYDNTSMGNAAIVTAFNAVNDWVLDLQANQGYDKTVYHIFAERERWLKWGVGMLEGFGDTTKYYPGHYKVEPVLAQMEADPTVNVYSGTWASSNTLSTLGPPTGDVLAICFIDESDNVYVNDWTEGPIGSGTTNPNVNTIDYLDPLFGNDEPKSNFLGDFQSDHTEYLNLYNNYTTGNVACFMYPTPNESAPKNFTSLYSQTILSALASITSGDNNDGRLANPPSTIMSFGVPGTVDTLNGGIYAGLVAPWGGTVTYNALKTTNPYFDQGFGELDKYGWGINVSFPNMSSTQLAIDLDEFVSTSDLCITETITEVEVNILCTGSTSTEINQYGLYTVEGFYQNALIDPSSTTNQYSSDSTFYGSWSTFLNQKIQEDGLTGIDFLNNNGASISTYTTWNQLSSSVATLSTPGVITTTTPGTPINIFDAQSQIFNNSAAGSNVIGNATQQLNWLIDNGHGQNLNGYYFTNDTLDETLAPYNNCTGTNLPVGGGVYCFVTDFTFTSLPSLTFSSAGGTYTNWHTFIDTLNSLSFTTIPGTTVQNYTEPCNSGTWSNVTGNTNETQSMFYEIFESTTSPAGTVASHTQWLIDNAPSQTAANYFFEDTTSPIAGHSCATNAQRYIKEFQLVCQSFLDTGTTQFAQNGYFGTIMTQPQNGTPNQASPTAQDWDGFLGHLNAACNAEGDANQFDNTMTLAQVLNTINTLESNHPRYEGTIVRYSIETKVETCPCNETTTGSTQQQVDIFTYQDDITDILNYFNSTLEITYSANIIVNYQAANCEDIPGDPIVTEETQSTAGNIPLYGQIDGGACVCIPETTGGESLDGDIEFESCICCPESSSIEVGCLVAGEVSSSRCECSADTYETIINFVSASTFDIIPSSSAKMVEFRIKPHRLDKPEYSSLEACCDPVITIPTASHLFSLYNESQPQTTPHLILRPYTGSDVSSSDDFRNFGSLDLYKNGSVVGSTDIFPVYNGAFWNIFIGTKGESGSNSEVYFGAYQSNFLGHVTHLTASATFSEYERAASFGDTAYNLANNTLPASTAYFCGVPTNSNTSGSVNSFTYSGSLQEIKYHVKDFLTHDTLTKHALDPFQYAGNTVSSSWENVHLRLPLGSNNKVDSASYNNNGLGIIQNFNPHPLFSLYESSSISSSITSQSFNEVYETHRHLTPDTVGISTTSEKVRIDSGSIDRSILSFDIKTETSTLDRQPLDYNDLGVFFSPQAEINEDIVYTLGAFRMDDYIGDPTHQSLAEYPDLEELKLKYFKKYLNSYRQNFFDYIKLIQYIDHTLFKMVEQFVPAKANLKTGLLIEPHYLERQKFARQIPTFERLEKEAHLLPYLDLEGEVKHYEACINISDKVNENYFPWMGALTASDNLYMSQSKYASDECNPYITLYDNFDPLYGNYVDCIVSKEYYYVSKPPQFNFGNDPTNPGINPTVGINPVNPSKGSGLGVSIKGTQTVSVQRSSTTTTSGGSGGSSYSS